MADLRNRPESQFTEIVEFDLDLGGLAAGGTTNVDRNGRSMYLPQGFFILDGYIHNNGVGLPGNISVGHSSPTVDLPRFIDATPVAPNNAHRFKPSGYGLQSETPRDYLLAVTNNAGSAIPNTPHPLRLVVILQRVL